MVAAPPNSHSDKPPSLRPRDVVGSFAIRYRIFVLTIREDYRRAMAAFGILTKPWLNLAAGRRVASRI